LENSSESDVRLHTAHLHETDPNAAIELAYALCGHGEPLLLLHGFTGCAADFAYAGREQLAARYRLIMPDARGHGGSSNGQPDIRHGQCARDALALLDQLGLPRVKAIGVSMGGNTLLHMARVDPKRLSAMVLVSATPRFPEQAKRIMRAVPPEPSPEDWQRLRVQHRRGDAQIRALWRAQRSLADQADDMCFSAADLSAVEARTLVYAGERDPLLPVTLAEELARGIPRAELVVVPSGHSPVFLEESPAFVAHALRFLAE
jgi:pimeloyl-ACP methyl ester carboxylesterase